MYYPIALKFGTQRGGVWAQLGTKFDWNTVYTYKAICTNMFSCPQGKLHMARS